VEKGNATDTSASQAVKWKQHLTLTLPKVYDDGCIWVHACSMGEVNSIAPLIRWLVELGHAVHLTVVTRTGMQQADRLFQNRIHTSYLPWDLPGLMARLVNHIKPKILLLTETEFWPGMLGACQRRDIPVIGINTRISDRSFPRYMATSSLWKRWLKPVRLFLAQSQVDAERLHALGIGKGRIQTVGNLKYAVSPPQVDASILRQSIDPSEKRPILLVASTHDDEEKRILKMWSQWKRTRPDLMLVIVPRHPERFDDVARAIEANGNHYSRWSNRTTEKSVETSEAITSEDILLIDAMGVLQQLYIIADIAIIGGTLAPVGGHNPLEAAVCGRGVVTGPNMQNFREIMEEMKGDGAAIVTASDEELEEAVLHLLQHPEALRDLHVRAADFIAGRAAVMTRVCEAVEPWLAETAQP
jgi:3-deoxy-D-manno-octulosonic-acid transferase